MGSAVPAAGIRGATEKQMKIEPLISPDAFVGLEGLTHLCTGGESPWMKSHQSVYADFARLKSLGYEGRGEVADRTEACRKKVARLWSVPADRVAFMPSASEGMNWLARGLDWSPGDNVVTTGVEFPSVAYAWRTLEARGVEVRRVPHCRWKVREEDLVAAVDDRTRVMAVSQVSFYTGQCLDLQRLAEGTSRRGVLLAVDATHASGVVEVPAGVTDLCVSSSYKWMLATHGVAPCYLSPRAENLTAATCFGWRNLVAWPRERMEVVPDVPVRPMPKKMEPGNPSLVSVMFLNNALNVLLSTGTDRIQEHARQLSARIAAGLERLGHTVITPGESSARSGNTCFLSDEAGSIHDHLRSRGILVWGELGRVRISGHLYNSSRDVDRLLAALADS